MPRIPFVEGAEALAVDMNTLQNATVVNYESMAQRDADWPDPPVGALANINAAGANTTDGLCVYAGSSRGWRWLHWKPGMGSTTEVIASRLSAAPQSGLATSGRPYPRGSYIQIADGGPNVYIVQRFTEGSAATKNVFFASGSTGYTMLAGPADASALHDLDFRLNTRNRDLMMTSQTTAGGANAYWLVTRWATNNRPEFQVYGKIISDNLPARLVERLEDLETRLAQAEAALNMDNAREASFYEHDTQQTPPPVVPDPPDADSDYQREN